MEFNEGEKVNKRVKTLKWEEFGEGKCQTARDLNGPKTGSIFFFMLNLISYFFPFHFLVKSDL